LQILKKLFFVPFFFFSSSSFNKWKPKRGFVYLSCRRVWSLGCISVSTRVRPVRRLCHQHLRLQELNFTPLRFPPQIALFKDKELHPADLQDALRCPAAGTGCNSQLTGVQFQK
jgi:hypothetical protein